MIQGERTELEFANCVWSPKLEKDRALIEGVLRRATRIVPGLKNLEYEDRLKELKIPSMSYRRVRGDLIETYKYVHGYYRAECPFELNNQGSTRGNAFKLCKRFSRTSGRQAFFSNRVVDSWNALPDSIVCAPSMNSFKNRLDRALQHYTFTRRVSHPLSPTTTALPDNE